jgi:hypothetical protein
MKELDRIKIDSKEYFIDERLSELRNINDPNDREPITPELIHYWKKNNIVEVYERGKS